MNDLNDERVIQKVSNGSEKAVREIYDRYHFQVICIAKKYLNNTSLYEYSVQNILLKVWLKWHKLVNVTSSKENLFPMVRNHVLNVLRDRYKELISISAAKENVRKSDQFIIDALTLQQLCTQLIQFFKLQHRIEKQEVRNLFPTSDLSNINLEKLCQ